MSAISLKSITGITSITTPAGVDNVFTVHTNDTTERFRVDSTGNLNIAGIVTVTKDLDVDGHTNLDNVSIAGVTTFAQKINLSDNFIRNCRGFNSGNEQARIVVKAGDNSAGGGLRIVEYYNDDTTLFSSEIANFYTNGIELKENVSVTGSGSFTKTSNNYILVGSSNAGGASLVLDGDSNGDGSGTDYAYIEHDSSGNLNIVGDNPANAANIIFKTNSTSERLRITSDGDLNVDSGTLYVDVSTNRIGINEASPSYPLDVYGDGGAAFSATTNSASGQISIVGKNSGGSVSAISRIKSEPSGNNNTSQMVFETRNISNAMVEAMRINSTQYVGIATHTPTGAWLDIATGSGAVDHIRMRRISSDSNIASNWSLKPYGGNLYFREGGSTDKIVFTDNPRIGIGGHTPGGIIDARTSGQADLIIGSTNAGGAYLLLDGDSNGDAVGSDYSYIAHDTSGDLLIGADNPANDADIVFKIGNNTEKLRLKASTSQMLLASGMLLNIGGSQGHCPLHVTTENTTYGKSAIFGASGWVNNANYHYTDATITLLGRDADNNDKGAGVEFTARNTGDSNWLHGAVTFGQDGGLRLFNGGAGTTVGSERFRIASDGVIHVNSPNSASGGRIWANSSQLYLQSGNGRQTFKVSDAAAGVNRTYEITTDGHLKFPAGYGIEFSGGTPNAGSSPTVNSAVFDDYEEGKFVPKFLENATTEASYAWQYGQYVKVAGIVHIRFAFGLNGFNSSGGTFTTAWVGGMPYTHASQWGTSDFAYIELHGYSWASGYGDSASSTGLFLELSQNADKFRIVHGNGKQNVNQSSIGTGQRFACTFSFPVA